MTLQDLRYLVALAEHGHFGRAAAACDVAQSTLSAQIKQLETRLGVMLFERTTKSVRVTAAGADVAGRGRRVLAEIDAIMTVGQSVAGPLAGGFSLGVIPTLGPYVLPWLVPALQRGFPALKLGLREDLTAPLLERLGSHRLDAALVALPVHDDRLESVPLFDEPFWLAEPVRAGSPPGEPLALEALRGQRFLLLTEGHCLRDQVLAICGASDHDSEKGGFRATSVETILQMVAAGLGRTLLPAMACLHAGTRAIATRPLEGGIGRRIGLVWRRSYHSRRDIQLLADTVRDHLPDSVRRV